MELVVALLLKFSAPGAVPTNALASEIVTVSKEHNLDPVLLTKVVLVESNAKPDAVSSTGDIGLMQINEVHGLAPLCAFNWKCNLRHGAKLLAKAPAPCAYNIGTNAYLNGKKIKKCLQYQEKLDNISL